MEPRERIAIRDQKLREKEKKKWEKKRNEQKKKNKDKRAILRNNNLNDKFTLKFILIPPPHEGKRGKVRKRRGYLTRVDLGACPAVIIPAAESGALCDEERLNVKKKKRFNFRINLDRPI